MTNLLKAIRRLVKAIWRATLATMPRVQKYRRAIDAVLRTAMAAAFVAAALLVATALTPLWVVRPIVAIVTAISLLGLACVVFMYPLYSLLIAELPIGKIPVIGSDAKKVRDGILRALALAYTVEFFIGFYLWWVPISADRWLVIPLIIALSWMTAARFARAKVSTAIATTAFVAITIVFLLGGRSMTKTTLADAWKQAPQANAAEASTVAAISPVRQFNPTYELACGEAFGPSLRDMTRIDKAVFTEPPDCVSGIIMVPKNAINVDVRTEDGAPIAGNWYYPESDVDSQDANPLSNLRKVPFADEENGINNHTWGVPVAFDLENPQSEKVRIEVRFSHNPI